MPALPLAPHQLRLTIDPATLGFASTAELQDLPLPWIGQERAHAAAQFGLNMLQPDYHLFVLGEVGSGRASLLRQAMQTAAAARPVPPDLCYLHNFDQPDRPRALRLPPGQGRVLRQRMADMGKNLQADIPRRLASPDFKADAERIEQAWQEQERSAFATLDAFAEARQVRLSRENGQMVFTLIGPGGLPLSEAEARTLPRERRAEIDTAEHALRAEITRFIETTRPLERARDETLAQLRRQTVQPLVQHALHDIRQGLSEPIIKDAVKLGQWLDQVEHAVLQNIDLFESGDDSDAGDDRNDRNGNDGNSSSNTNDDAEQDRQDALDDLLARCSVNLVVDHHGQTTAPVLVEDHPTLRSLFGGIEHGSDSDTVQADHAAIHAGSLLKAHGGFILLHLYDLAAEEGLWARLRRFLRCGRLQIDEGSPGTHAGGGGGSGGAAAALQPEPVDVDVKIVLIGSVDEYYAMQESDPDAARRFRAKVDFAERFAATPATRQATAIFVAHSCQRRGLPHFAAGAVALLLEQTHRDADDQGRQSALFAHTEALLIESAALCRARGGALVEAPDVAAALAAQRLRHNYPEEQLHESITEGERLITLQGAVTGQINAMTQIDLGDYRFGFPVRITARTFAGQEGLLNIEREVDMSGPIHDKGVLILHSYLTALFSHVAPLALNASIVFEQEYSGVEGDSASCAELYALLSSLSGLPLHQGIAVTGALNQHGEVLPVGGINEKIEGWFQACVAAGLDGTQGVLIPSRNRRHLMLDRSVLDAVERGLFSVYTMGHVSEGIALLTGEASGMSPAELLNPVADARENARENAAHAPHAAGAAGIADVQATAVEATVLQRAEQTLRAYRRACQTAGYTRRARGQGR
ncbi:ATP-dependent protease [Acidovorax sp. Leaf76]|uniref:Lon protease family protein n=1 Tax=unclassified Acidovorax TaxID=2684926 RepID=UPI0006FB49EA|nr:MULTISPECIES: ATP-binding protein [unclassified Acidovorax]KQO15098.1 ATP-dependent protease [Acidovorax sp. Leaf76]KQO31908.1 ATP-dependent protease [Acidovorax sp. Leaf84]KQS28969.1 ATP-dependent protease [Acidovorax sp. Leaf191]